MNVRNLVWSGALAVVCSFTLAQTVQQSRIARTVTIEDYAILRAVLGDLYGGANTTGVVLIDHTSTGYPPGLAATTQVRKESDTFFHNIPTDIKDDFAARNKNYAELKANKLSMLFEVVLANEQSISDLVIAKNGWKTFHDSYPKAQGILVVSCPGINRNHSHALVYVGNSCGPTCGGGTWVFLSHETGQWKVVDKASAWLT